MYLLEFLTSKELTTSDEHVASVWLRHPWCWPRTPRLEERALTISGDQRPRPPALGLVCLVTVAERSDLAELWSYGGDQGPLVQFDPETQRVEETARVVATRDLPLFGRTEPLHEPHRRGAWRIAAAGKGNSLAIRGTSCGLAVSLSTASLYLDTPVSSDLLATAAVEKGGRVGEVRGLEGKLAMIVGTGLGIRRVLVAESQVEEAKAALRKAGERGDAWMREITERGIHVVGVENVADAIGRVFDVKSEEAIAKHVARLWPEIEDARAAAGKYYRIAIQPASRPLLDWNGFARAAAMLAGKLAERGDPESMEAQWHASIAGKIAKRHTGDQALIPMPDAQHLSSTPRPLRLRLLAHVVQSAADSDSDRIAEYMAQARQHLAPALERHAEDLALLGALGRAAAAVGGYEEAAVFLREALDGWVSIQQEYDLSYALCEYIRVQGIVGLTREVEAARDIYFPALLEHPATSHQSVAFARAALGRAFVQCHNPEEALRHLGEHSAVDWDLTSRHLVASRRRWWARALGASDRTSEAQRTREELLHWTDPEAHVSGVLARLDAALERGENAGPLLGTLLDDVTAGAEARRLVHMLKTAGLAMLDDDLPKLVAEHYRY